MKSGEPYNTPERRNQALSNSELLVAAGRLVPLRQGNETLIPNPYTAPTADAVDPSHSVIQSAKQRLSRPATALIVLASIHSVLITIPIVSIIFTLSQASSITRGQISVDEILALSIGAFQLTLLILIAIGAAKMGFLESYRMGRLGACLACIPFVTPFILLGLPFGIWSLVLLRQPEITAAFDAKKMNQRKT